MHAHHPSIGNRFKKVAAAGEKFRPWFGAWHEMTVNFAREGEGNSVKTKPHVDGKNPAVAFCAVIAFGEWSRGSRRSLA